MGLLVGWLTLFCGLLPAQAQFASIEEDDGAPKEAVIERLGKKIPTTREFLDSKGNIVSFASLLADGDKPAIVSMNYSRCPKLCDLQLDRVVRALDETGLVPGKDFHFVSVTLDPKENTVRAAEAKRKYVALFGKASAQDGFHFWTAGTYNGPENIKAIADGLGIEYTYVAYRDEFIHPAVFCVISPKGKITRYLYGLEIDPQTLRLAVVEGSQGKVGTTLDRVLLLCTAFNPDKGVYSPVVLRIMVVGCGVFAALLFLGLVPFWVRGRLKSADPAGS